MKTCPRCKLRYPAGATTCFVDGETLVAMADPRIGLVISGRYEVERVLAEGGMATVYVARNNVTGREVAVKILSPALARNKVVCERFRREAKATQKLAHPNIIEILDHGETNDGLSYLVMELLVGETLADAIEFGPMELDDALPIALQVARALARAHDFDVVHRDLKPENVFLCERDNEHPLVKLLDFGIARSMHDGRLTAAGDVFGTPQYMAPERIMAVEAGPSSDLYSFGVMFFEMLAGRLPFKADSIAGYFVCHTNESPPTLASFGIQVPAQIEAMIASLMAKTESKRPVDSHAVCIGLTEFCVDSGIDVPPEPNADQEIGERLTLPAATIDRWAHRASIFDRMLAATKGEKSGVEAEKLLPIIHRKVRELDKLRADAVKAQQQLSEFEAQTRAGRQRFGNAVEGLGVDASQAREDARTAREHATTAAKKTAVLRDRVRKLHPNVICWEGRCAFEQPHRELADAYRAIADAIDPWCAARALEQQAESKANELDGVVSDLEYQINELRAGLLRLEASSEQDRAAIEHQSTTLGQKADALEQELLDLAIKFCVPMRTLPAASAFFPLLETK